MNILLFAIFTIISLGFLYVYLSDQKSLNPLYLMLATWSIGVAIPRLNLSALELPWDVEFWTLLVVSIASFIIGFVLFAKLWTRFEFWKKIGFLNRENVSISSLRLVIYVLFVLSVVSLLLFYQRAGNFPLLAADTDVFRFEADEEVPGLINYFAQAARLFIPLAFFAMFWERFNLKKHWDLILLCLLGAAALILFASRTQIFFIDLWVMAMYLVMRKPNWKQSLKFYPVFLIVSVLVLTAVPLIRQYKSYGSTSYLAGVTQIRNSENPAGKLLLPIYVGVSFNMQSLLHAQDYYEVNPIQHGLVTLDPFTNIVGLDQYKSDYDLCEIFQCWWNTGTYLFPFVQDFGNVAFFVAPFIFAGLIALVWRYWLVSPNFLSINLYAYTCFFVVMTIYLSFTVRAEMYIDLFLLLLIYLAVSNREAQTS